MLFALKLIFAILSLGYVFFALVALGSYPYGPIDGYLMLAWLVMTFGPILIIGGIASLIGRVFRKSGDSVA